MSSEQQDLFCAEMASSQDLLMFLELFPTTKNAQVIFDVYLTHLRLRIDRSHLFSMTCTLPLGSFDNYRAASPCDFRVDLTRLIYALSVLGTTGGKLTLRYADTGEPLQLQLSREGAVTTCSLPTLAPEGALAHGHGDGIPEDSRVGELAGADTVDGVSSQSDVCVGLLREALQGVLCSKAKRVHLRIHPTVEAHRQRKERRMREWREKAAAQRAAGAENHARQLEAKADKTQAELAELTERPQAHAVPLLQLLVGEEGSGSSTTISFPSDVHARRPSRRGKGTVLVFAHHRCHTTRMHAYTLADLRLCVRALARGDADGHCNLRIGAQGTLSLEIEIATGDRQTSNTVAYTLLPHDDDQHRTQ